MKRFSRKGLALIETFLIGAVVTAGVVALLTPYADNIGKLIKGDAPTASGTVKYGAPPPATILPNTGAQGVASSPAGGCNNLTMAYLRTILSDSQYQYLTSIGMTDSTLNSATENYKGPDGKIYTYPKYMLTKNTDDGKYYIYAFSGNSGDTGYNPASANEGGKLYYVFGASFTGDTVGDPPVTGTFNVWHPWLDAYQSNGLWLYKMDFAGSHCPTFTTLSTPLILDINGDGKISAKAGIGVDINGDGRPDGAAVDGDKMLAMNPMYGDKKITGKEVFGDHTIDPFTGVSLKAKNGFIALKQIALSAQKHTRINCMEGSYADIRKINSALKKAKKGKIGLISDNNVTVLEPLGKVAKINTDYTQVSQHSEDQIDVKHRQISNWLDVKNISHVIHDVWFAVTSSVKKLISNIAKTFSFQT